MSNQIIQHDSNGRVKYNPQLHPNHKKPWTTHEQKYLIDFYGKDKPADISLALGRTIGTVMDRACDLRKQGLIK
ncbi:MAG: hypothetical protein ACI843_001574 [Psychrobacter glaciei]|jgi:hypothetical protein